VSERGQPSPRAAVAASQLPEAGHFWIRYRPRVWEPPASPWLDLSRAALGNARRWPHAANFAAFLATPLDDLLYLPPVPAELAEERSSLAVAHLDRGTPVLLQLRCGEPLPLPVGGGLLLVVDLLEPLLEGNLELLARVPAAATAVWPLLPGMTDEPALWHEGCGRLAAAGVRTVQALTPQLAPAERRRFAEQRGEHAFAALFHRPPPSEQAFAQQAARLGIQPFVRRPLPRPPLRGASNRLAAGALALAGELATRLGRPVERTQALFRAARWIDRTGYDLDALARDGHLQMVEALDEPSRRLVSECLAGGEPGMLSELLAAYVAQPADVGAAEGTDAQLTRP
jgi:hypothetical protein